MSISSIFGTALTGLQASQSALTIVSQNIANANTPGYARAQPQFTPQLLGGVGSGVNVQSVTRAADRFLAAAQHIASATQGASGVRADLLDRAQLVFGDPNGDQTFFTAIDSAFAGFQTAASDPTSAVARRNAIASVQDMLAEFSRAAQSVENLRLEADQRLGEAVTSANGLLQRISDLNNQISLTRKTSGDATSAESARDQLVDQLSGLVDVRTTAKLDGSVELRTASGALLVGNGAATLTYNKYANAFGPAGTIVINSGLPTESQFDPNVGGGQIAGLIKARDVDLPGLGDSIAGLAAQFTDIVNQAHANNAGYPPAPSLVGRQTGLLGADSLNFTGAAVVGVVDGVGTLVRRVTIDFDAGQITTESPADTRAFANTVAGLTTALNDVLQLAPAQGVASFSNGALSISGGSGFVLGDVAGNVSSREGRTFAHFFGLNDLVRGAAPTFFEAGIAATDVHGLNGGGLMSFQITDPNGRVIANRDITVSGTTWGDYVAALNNPTTGIGQYAVAAFDAAGRLTITPNTGYKADLTADTTRRGGTGVSTSSLFGIGRGATATRALGLSVNQAIVDQPTRLGLGRPDLTAAIGARIIEGGDSRGADALSAAREQSRSFAAAGALPQQVTTLALYAARLAGEAGRSAEQAAKARTGAEAVYGAASERRARTEGVSLDEELVKMTQFQQSYAAASRVIQAATEMLDILMSLK